MDFSKVDVRDILRSFDNDCLGDVEGNLLRSQAYLPEDSDLKDEGITDRSIYVMSSESDGVPCPVCRDTHLPQLFETGLFGNKPAQDDLYYHLGHEEDRIAIAESKRKENGSLWQMASRRMLEAISLTYDSEREASNLYDSALELKKDYDKKMQLYYETAKEFDEVVEDVEKLHQLKDMTFAENRDLIASKNQILVEYNVLKQKNAILEEDKKKLSQEVEHWKSLYFKSLSSANNPNL